MKPCPLRSRCAPRSDLRTPSHADDGQRRKSACHTFARSTHQGAGFPFHDHLPRPWRWSLSPPENSGSAAEIVSRDDHQADTVIKKQLYEDIRVPRLWMIDPRYDNVEIYHCTEWGLRLKGILAGSEVLGETLIPEFQIVIAELFADRPAAKKILPFFCLHESSMRKVF